MQLQGVNLVTSTFFPSPKHLCLRPCNRLRRLNETLDEGEQVVQFNSVRYRLSESHLFSPEFASDHPNECSILARMQAFRYSVLFSRRPIVVVIFSDRHLHARISLTIKFRVGILQDENSCFKKFKTCEGEKF